ncbi:hypothetical protein G3567_01900 [Psychroflexus sp. YR1-1]|uniref:Transposase n=1 Tax=Psychroflexus aurantiacus TaxID=2709310 RepID=A0A6B3QYU7_9FLAO|nr:hypothetical protein [Psychroflexus aurantiacus]NEV92898.1 hypothetical protein [Psychroflexus aurantiacus]
MKIKALLHAKFAKIKRQAKQIVEYQLYINLRSLRKALWFWREKFMQDADKKLFTSGK